MEKKIIKLDFNEDNSLSIDKPKKLSFFRRNRGVVGDFSSPLFPNEASILDKKEKEIKEKLKIVRDEIKKEKERQNIEKEKINKQKEINNLSRNPISRNKTNDLGDHIDTIPLNPFEWFNHKSCSNCGNKLKKSKVKTDSNGELYQEFKCKKCDFEHEVRIKL